MLLSSHQRIGSCVSVQSSIRQIFPHEAKIESRIFQPNRKSTIDSGPMKREGSIVVCSSLHRKFRVDIATRLPTIAVFRIESGTFVVLSRNFTFHGAEVRAYEHCLSFQTYFKVCVLVVNFEFQGYDGSSYEADRFYHVWKDW